MGISLGAGIGRLQGKYGYLHDNMVSARLLLGNGTVIKVSEDTNPDLFWAVRGAGHNFGIVLEATFQVYPQLNHGQHFVVDFEFELDKVDEIFEALNSLADSMPKEVAVFVIGRRQGSNGKVSLANDIQVVMIGADNYTSRLSISTWFTPGQKKIRHPLLNHSMPYRRCGKTLRWPRGMHYRGQPITGSTTCFARPKDGRNIQSRTSTEQM